MDLAFNKNHAMDRALNILLVEDAEADAELQIRELKRSGLACNVRRVQTESAFVSQLSEFKPDIIVSDFAVPGFGGLRALEISRDRVPDIPFVFVSGTIGEDTAVESLKRGATDYVLKTNLVRLAPALRRAIKESQERRARRLAEQRNVNLANLYAALSETNAALARSQERRQLFHDICRIAVERGGFRLAWVGLADHEAGIIRPAALFGTGSGLLEGREVPLKPDRPGGRGPMATATREGRSYVCNDILADEHLAFWHDKVNEYGFRSAAAVPLLLGGGPIGAFGLYASESGYFDEERMQLLTELAAGISFALDRFEQETRRKRAEAEILEARQQLQALSNRLLEVQEDERRDLARELHDEIGQALTLIKIKLQVAQRRKSGDAALLDECTQIADYTLEQVRNLSLNLRPPLLDDIGLEAALKWMLNRQENASRWEMTFTAEPLPGRLATEIETACFRIAQEALTNVARHADARKVEVQLRIAGGELDLAVRDDGRGFDPEAVRRRGAERASLGLISMKERAILAGGRFDITAASDGGTVVRAIFPLRWRDGHGPAGGR